MAIIELKKNDIIWSYVGQLLNIGVNFLLIPITIKILPAETYSIWQLFVIIYLFLNLLDFGFRPTFIRNIAYVYSGSTSLEKKGLKVEKVLNEPNFPLLKSLSHFMKLFYGGIAIFMLIIALTLGSYYIYSLAKNLPDIQNIMSGWYLYAVAISLSFYILYYTTTLNGCGFIKQGYQIVAFSKILYFVLTIILLYLGYGLASFGWGMLISCIFNYLLALYFFRKVKLAQELQKAIKENVKIFSIVSYNAIRVGIVNISLFFTTRGSIFLASFFLSLKSIGEYGLTLQFVGIMTVIGQLYLQTNIPKISGYRINNNNDGVKKIIGETLIISLVIYILAGILLVVWGNPILEIFGSNTYLIDTWPLILLLSVYLLDMNHNIAIQIITTKNEIPHLWACIITGLVITILTILLLKYTNLGLYAIILSIGLTQLMYQNWKWPYVVMKELQTNYFDLLKIGYTSLIHKR